MFIFSIRPKTDLFEKQNRLCDLNCGGRCANTFFLERNMQFSSLNTWYSQVWACGVSESMIFPWFTRMSSAYCILLPSQGVEPRRSAAVKVSLPGRHPVELVVPRHQFFGPLFLVVGPWDGNQRQGGHWCRYHVDFAPNVKIHFCIEQYSISGRYIHTHCNWIKIFIFTDLCTYAKE